MKHETNRQQVHCQIGEYTCWFLRLWLCCKQCIQGIICYGLGKHKKKLVHWCTDWMDMYELPPPPPHKATVQIVQCQVYSILDLYICSMSVTID